MSERGYESKVMNIPCEVPRDSDVWGNFAHAFKCGHRDARHAAAEHAAQADARIAELEAEVAKLQRQVAEWEKLGDPVTLHVNLLRGIPCKLDRETLLHLAGDEAGPTA